MTPFDFVLWPRPGALRARHSGLHRPEAPIA